MTFFFDNKSVKQKNGWIDGWMGVWKMDRYTTCSDFRICMFRVVLFVLCLGIFFSIWYLIHENKRRIFFNEINL